MKLSLVFPVAAICAIVHLTNSTETTITPLRFFLRNLFKKKPLQHEIMESGIVEPSDIEDLKKSFSGRKRTTAKPMDIGDFLSPLTRDGNDDENDFGAKKKPKGLFAALFQSKRKEKKTEDNDLDSSSDLLKDLPLLSNALRAIRTSGQQTLRSIIKAILPSLFSS